MARHSWKNRTIPPLLAIAIVGCVWYALDSRPEAGQTDTSAAANAAPSPQNGDAASARVLPPISPTVRKFGQQVQFTVNPAAMKHVQKVEFYVESQFVGTAYSQPYTVAVNENNLTAGTHKVVAKIYTDATTAQSQPATFTAKPVAPPAQNMDTSDAEGAAVIANTGGTSSSGNEDVAPAGPTAPDVPSNLAASAGDDGTSATLTWMAVGSATGYQVWRDGSQVASTAGTGYTDTGLTPGQTYDYTVIALNGSAASDPSDMVAVTMPTPPPDSSPVNTLSPKDDPSSSADLIDPDATPATPAT